MEQPITLLAFLIIGFAVGVIATWLILRGRIAAVNDSQLEAVRLNERLLATQEENSRNQQVIKMIREKAELLQTRLQEESNRGATLAEQVVYLPELAEKVGRLEVEQAQLKHILADQREKIGASETAISHQLAHIQQLEQEKNNLTASKFELINYQQALMAKIAELTTQLDAERAQSGEKIALLNDAKTQLSDQFKALASDILEEKSKRFKQAQHSYDDAFKKLTIGNGNVIRQAQMLKDMGIKPSKSLPTTMIESALEEHSMGDIAPH